MSLNLDPRQRAMLAELGVRVWWPQATPAPLGVAAAAAGKHPSEPNIATVNVAGSAGAARARGPNLINSSGADGGLAGAASALAPAAGVTATGAAAAAGAMAGVTTAGAAAAAGAMAGVTTAGAAAGTSAAAGAVAGVTAAGAAATAAQPLRPHPPTPAGASRALPPHQPVVLPPGPAAVWPLAGQIADMDWPALGAAVATCQGCTMCLGRQAAVFVPPPADLRCDWLLLGEPPDEAQERAGQPFVDDAGKLLDNMLRAIGVRRAPAPQTMAPAGLSGVPASATPGQLPQYAYLSLVLKCRPAHPTATDAVALAACAHYLRREIALLQPKVILALGRFAMQVLLGEAHPDGLRLPLGKLRGQVWHYQGVPVVVTYPPAYLLRHGQDKARAWADLCLAQDVVQGVAQPV